MSKKKIFRKPSPQPPNWFWLETDGCWNCNCDHHGCNNCKRLKEIDVSEKKNKKSSLIIKAGFFYYPVLFIITYFQLKNQN